MKYAASTGGFYHPDIHGDSIPEDAVKITAKQHQALLDGQAAGKQIVAGKNGKPRLAEVTPDLLGACKAEARQRLAATDWSQTTDVAAAIKNAAAFTEYRAAVRALFREPVKTPVWPALPDPIWA